VIRGGATTPPNQDFIKNKKHRFSTAARTVTTYDISFLRSICETFRLLLYRSDMIWGE